MTGQILTACEQRMEKQVEFFRGEVSAIRAGRANPALVNDIPVDYYGTSTPIRQLATVTTPEPRLLVIQPWDKNALKDVERAIMTSDLGIMPNNDGSVIRLAIPQLTEERRRDLAAMARKKAEESRVAIRNLRRDANDQIRKAEKNGDISEDEAHRLLGEVQNLTDTHIEQIDQITADKESEIMEV
ncbi:MAG: ribosome recycling factor [Bacillota bacterium]|jgi:ribosome recycling factor